jgi:hypothetical protein
MCLLIISVISWRLSHYRRSHRAAATALPPRALCAAAAAPPPSCRQRCAVALSRCCHCLATAKLPPTSAFALPPTSAFALPPTSAFALPPLPQLPAADLVLLRYRHWRCHRCRRCFRRRAAVRWLVVAL